MPVGRRCIAAKCLGFERYCDRYTRYTYHASPVPCLQLMVRGKLWGQRAGNSTGPRIAPCGMPRHGAQSRTRVMVSKALEASSSGGGSCWQWDEPQWYALAVSRVIARDHVEGFSHIQQRLYASDSCLPRVPTWPRCHTCVLLLNAKLAQLSLRGWG